jgi:hypothetical protein
MGGDEVGRAPAGADPQQIRIRGHERDVPFARDGPVGGVIESEPMSRRELGDILAGCGR